jgi:hypothetical protein
MSLIAGFILGLAAAASNVTAVRVTVVEHQGPLKKAAASGTLRMTPVGGASASEASPITAAFTPAGATPVELRDGLVWELRAEAEGWWSAPVTLFVAGAPAVVTLDLWPACKLRGRVTTPEPEKAPPSVAVHFATTNPPVVRGRIVVVPDKDEPPFGDVGCPVKEGRLACTVAAGNLDLKVKAAGFVPVYLWGRKAPERGVLDLGTLALKPGASLTGTVTTAEGPADPKTCELSLKPLATGPLPLEEMGRPRTQVGRARPDARGFFNFDAVSAGLYELEARQAGWATTVRAPIRIEERSETRLPDRLVFERPLTLSVEVSPPLDLQGREWTLQVFTLGAGDPSQMNEAFKQAMSRDGTLSRQGMAPGRYKAALLDSEGAYLLWQGCELSASSPPLVLEVRFVPVTGTVTLGDRPLVASLAFGGNAGPKFETDAEGAFRGVLPREGAWTVTVTATDPPVHRTLRRVEVKRNPELKKAEIELRLPDNRLTGTVGDESGKPVANAFVRLFHKDSVDFESTLSGDGGRFEFRGLANGRVAVRAEDTTPAGPRYSDEVNAELSEEGAAPDVRLVLTRSVEVAVIVTSETGEPVAGAWVQPYGDLSRQGALAFSQLTTDSTGTVKIRLPADIERLAGVVLPFGYAFQAFDAALERGRPVSVVVTRFGGTLTLQFASPPPLQDWSRALIGWQDGVLFGASMLLDWGRINGVAVDWRGTVFTIPQVAPGRYRVCLGPVVQVLEEGSAYDGRGGTCAEGSLPRLGELRLEL